MMAREVFTVRHRAPDVPIQLPPTRPNTGLANRTYVGLLARDSGQATRFRTAVYNALWVHGLDISAPDVIEQVLNALDFVPPVVDAACTLGQWQREWEQGPFDLRIPSMMAEDGRVLLGLSSPADIGAFLDGQETSGVSSGVCEFVPRPVVLVVGPVHGVWPHVRRLNHSCDVQIAVDSASALASIEDHTPDAVVLNLAEAHVRTVRELTAGESLLDVPVIAMAPTLDEKSELELYRAGASDVMSASIDPELFHARMQVQLSVRRKLERLSRAARIDGLTQVPNRSEFDRVAALEWRRGIRSKLPLSILMIDVDHFKAYNDHFGHLQGDGALRHVAAAIASVCGRASDTVARYGGEEFAAILPDTNEQAARFVAERVREHVASLELPHPVGGPEGIVTISVGTATAVPKPDLQLTDLIDSADESLLRAKRGGRNCVRTF